MGKKSFAVLGLGKFGRSVAMEMERAGAEVLAVDWNEEIVHEVSEYVTVAMKADVCDVETMSNLGLRNMDGVVIAITGNFDASVMATLLAKEAGVTNIIVKTQDDLHGKILEKVGATKAIIPERESGCRVARSMVSGNFVDFFALSNHIYMVEMEPKPEWIGKTLAELNLRKTQKINIVAIRKNDEINVVFDPHEYITEDCTMLVTVDKKDVGKLSN